jgi:hypothetical protein
MLHMVEDLFGSDALVSRAARKAPALDPPARRERLALHRRMPNAGA